MQTDFDKTSNSGTLVKVIAKVVATLLVLAGAVIFVLPYVISVGKPSNQVIYASLLSSGIYFVAAWVAWAVLTAIGDAASNTFALKAEIKRQDEQITKLIELVHKTNDRENEK